MKKLIAIIAVLSVFAGGAFAADLSVEAQFDVTGKDVSKNFLTVKGAAASVAKDTVDATTGASRNKGTEVWNAYRSTADKKANFGGGIQSLVKYGVSMKDFEVDNLTVSKAANGIITIQYAHRGTAYKMITDASGKLDALSGNMVKRSIGYLKDGSQVLYKDFSPSGHAKDLNWAKVWDDKVAAGALMAKSTSPDGKVTELKVGPVAKDLPTADKPYAGTFIIGLSGNIMTVKADLDLKK